MDPVWGNAPSGPGLRFAWNSRGATGPWRDLDVSPPQISRLAFTWGATSHVHRVRLTSNAYAWLSAWPRSWWGKYLLPKVDGSRDAGAPTAREGMRCGWRGGRGPLESGGGHRLYRSSATRRDSRHNRSGPCDRFGLSGEVTRAAIWNATAMVAADASTKRKELDYPSSFAVAKPTASGVVSRGRGSAS